MLKNIYNDKLDDLVNKHNNTYNSTVKVKPVDIKPNTDINSSKEITDKDPTFKITAPWTNASNDLNGEGKEIIETF